LRPASAEGTRDRSPPPLVRPAGQLERQGCRQAERRNDPDRDLVGCS